MKVNWEAMKFSLQIRRFRRLNSQIMPLRLFRVSPMQSSRLVYLIYPQTIYINNLTTEAGILELNLSVMYYLPALSPGNHSLVLEVVDQFSIRIIYSSEIQVLGSIETSSTTSPVAIDGSFQLLIPSVFVGIFLLLAIASFGRIAKLFRTS